MVLAVGQVQGTGLFRMVGISLLSTNPTHKTAKAPDFTSPRLLVERIFVFDCLVEELLPLKKPTVIFSSPKAFTELSLSPVLRRLPNA